MNNSKASLRRTLRRRYQPSCIPDKCRYIHVCPAKHLWKLPDSAMISLSVKPLVLCLVYQFLGERSLLAAACSRSMIPLILLRNHLSILSRLIQAAPRPSAHVSLLPRCRRYALVVAGLQFLYQVLVVQVWTQTGCADRRTLISMEVRAFSSALSKVLQMDMTSPVAFIWCTQVP